MLNDNKFNILIGAFYRHPAKTLDGTFTEELKIILNEIKIEKKKNYLSRL